MAPNPVCRDSGRAGLASVASVGVLSRFPGIGQQFGDIAVYVIETVALKFTELDTDLEFVSGNAAHVNDVAICQHRDGLCGQDRDGKAGFYFNPVPRSRRAHTWNELLNNVLVAGNHHSGS